MKELVVIVAAFQIISLCGIMAYIIEETSELKEFNDIMQNGNQDERDEAINEYMDDFVGDLVNITNDEVKNISKDMILDSIDK